MELTLKRDRLTRTHIRVGEANIPQGTSKSLTHVGSVFLKADGSMTLRAAAFPFAGQKMKIEFFDLQPASTSDLVATIKQDGPYNLSVVIGEVTVSGDQGSITFFGIPLQDADIVFGQPHSVAPPKHTHPTLQSSS